MKSFSFSLMVLRPQRLSFILMLFALSFIISSCEKEKVQSSDIQGPLLEEHFFTFDYLSSHNPNLKNDSNGQTLVGSNQSLVLEVIQEIKQVDAEKPFASEFIKKFGYPIWDRAEVHTKDQRQVVLIPLVPTNGTNVEGAILALFQGSAWNFSFLDFSTQAGSKLTQLFFTTKLFSNEELEQNLQGVELENIRFAEESKENTFDTRGNCTTYWIDYAFCIEVSMAGVGSAGTSCETLTETITVCNFDSPSISPANPGNDSGGGGSSNDAAVPWDRICERSFNYQTVGESYTASLAEVNQKYVNLPMNILDSDFVGFKSDMCISVPRRDQFGQFMSIARAQELTVSAYEKARGQVMDGIVRDIINTPTQASAKFKEYFNQKLKDAYFWNPWAIRANLSRCRGLSARIPSYGC